jgi:hypothetical protein
MKNQNLELYMDYVIVESILSNPNLVKQAQLQQVAGSLLNKISDYVGSHVDPNNKTHDIINLIAPTGVRYMLSGLGMPVIGFLFDILARVFHFDLATIFENIFNKLKSIILSGEKAQPQQISSIVKDEVNKYNTTPNEDEFQKGKKIKESLSFDKRLRDARFVKLALFGRNTSMLEKIFGDYNSYSRGKPMFASVFITILSFIFKVILGSAGFMVGADLIRDVVGLKDDKSTKSQPSTPTTSTSTSVPEAKQTKFPLKSSYSKITYNTPSEFWAEDYSNNEQGITQMLLDFTNEVYDDVDNSAVLNTPSFKTLVDKIEFYNQNTPKDKRIVFIPKAFHTKKEIVDLFIDYVAARTP